MLTFFKEFLVGNNRMNLCTKYNVNIICFDGGGGGGGAPGVTLGYSTLSNGRILFVKLRMSSTYVKVEYCLLNYVCRQHMFTSNTVC